MVRERTPEGAPAHTDDAVKAVRVSKGTQAVLFLLYTALLLLVTLAVQGGPGVKTNLDPFEDVRRLMTRAKSGDVLSNAFLYAVVGLVGNTIMFAIWGFLAWKFLDGRDRRAWRTHLDVLLFGLLLSVGIETIQAFLPTRAADVNDVFWNVLGTLLGQCVAHVDRSLTLEWERT